MKKRFLNLATGELVSRFDIRKGLSSGIHYYYKNNQGITHALVASEKGKLMSTKFNPVKKIYPEADTTKL